MPTSATNRGLPLPPLPCAAGREPSPDAEAGAAFAAVLDRAAGPGEGAEKPRSSDGGIGGESGVAGTSGLPCPAAAARAGEAGAEKPVGWFEGEEFAAGGAGGGTSGAAATSEGCSVATLPGGAASAASRGSAGMAVAGGWSVGTGVATRGTAAAPPAVASTATAGAGPGAAGTPEAGHPAGPSSGAAASPVDASALEPAGGRAVAAGSPSAIGAALAAAAGRPGGQLSGPSGPGAWGLRGRDLTTAASCWLHGGPPTSPASGAKVQSETAAVIPGVVRLPAARGSAGSASAVQVRRDRDAGPARPGDAAATSGASDVPAPAVQPAARPAPPPPAPAPVGQGGAVPLADVPPALAGEPEPLPGAVRLRGVRAARISVPMDDGTTLRARVDVRDEAVEVTLRGSQQVGLLAERRVSDLRGALADRGMLLASFDVAADSERGAGTQGSARDPRDGGQPWAGGPPPSPGARLAQERPAPCKEQFSTIDDEGRGALLSRRF